MAVRPVKYTVNTTGTMIFLTRSQSIVNDGSADVYLLPDNIPNIKSDDAPLKAGETFNITFKQEGDQKYWLKCLTGTATVRIFGSDDDVSIEISLNNTMTTLNGSNLPTSDPAVEGKLWIAPDGKIVVSAG